MLRTILCAVLLPVVFFFLPFISFAGGGILEIRSEPSGARISIDDVDAGTTPYQNLEVPAGKHKIKAVLSPEFPPQLQDVLIDERSPQVITFKFVHKGRGIFVGREMVRTISKYKGSVTFASIPTGALVVINGEPLKKPAPIGYTDVEVGRYRVEFLLDGRTLRADFDVIQGETVKIIADFAAGKVINNREKAKLDQEEQKVQAAKQDPKQEEAKRAEERGRTEQAPQPQPEQPAVPAPSKPDPAEGGPPYGELLITMNVLRNPGLKYSDFFDISFPKVPIDSLSGAVFPASATSESTSRDNFEYVNDAGSNTRRFTARLDFDSQNIGRRDGRARSSVMTVREGTYELKITRRRMVDGFYNVEKLLDATAREPIEIVRGNRLTVQIDSHIGAENTLRYEIKRIYENLTKKNATGKQAVSKEATKNSVQGTDYMSIPIFGGQN